MEKINGLFGALVSSVMNYGSQVWAPRHIDLVEKLQSNFYKKLFLLPPNTPGYAVRNEFGVCSTSCNVLKLILNWLDKVLSMEEERYPRIALEILFEIYHTPGSNPKYSWLTTFKDVFLAPIGEEGVLDTLEDLANRRRELLCKFRDFKKCSDLGRC